MDPAVPFACGVSCVLCFICMVSLQRSTQYVLPCSSFAVVGSFPYPGLFLLVYPMCPHCYIPNRYRCPNRYPNPHRPTCLHAGRGRSVPSSTQPPTRSSASTPRAMPRPSSPLSRIRAASSPLDKPSCRCGFKRSGAWQRARDAAPHAPHVVLHRTPVRLGR